MAGAQPSARLAELGITLPAVAAPVAAYVPAKQVGSQVWTSGQLPFVDGALGITGKVGAKCDDDRGFLLIGDADAAQHFVVAGYVLPGNNYHVYDITLFWANVRADALRRLAAFEGKASPVPPPAAALPLPTKPAAAPPART